METGGNGRRGVGIGRSLLLGAGLAALNAIWVTLVEVRYYMLDGSSLPLFITPVFLLLTLVALNAPLRKWTPRVAFAAGRITHCVHHGGHFQHVRRT